VSESSEAFTPDEVTLILDTANELGQDPYHLVEFLLHFGIHPCKVDGLSSENIKKRRLEGEDVFFLGWRRAKTEEDVGLPVMPQDMWWLPDFLDRTPYGSRWSIDRQLTRIQDRIEKRGYFVNVCARRFRHTCCVMLLQRRIPEPVIRRALGVSAKTLETYAKFRFEVVYKMLKETGWGSPSTPPPQS